MDINASYFDENRVLKWVSFQRIFANRRGTAMYFERVCYCYSFSRLLEAKKTIHVLSENYSVVEVRFYQD